MGFLTIEHSADDIAQMVDWHQTLERDLRVESQLHIMIGENRSLLDLDVATVDFAIEPVKYSALVA